MSALGGLLGLGGGDSGTGQPAPAGYSNAVSPIVTPTNMNQINSAYTGNQQALNSQQALLSALQGQNGVGNQSQVYGQLQGVVNGTGPNPAQAMLNQSTGQNVANQAALMAGQRGAGSNVGLIARQAAQQGAATQQQAVGQGATLQANQSLNALNSAGNIANTQVANQIGATTANTGAQQAEQQALLGAQASANTANAGLQGNINSNNTQLANTTMQGTQGLIGGVLNGAGALVGLASGGEVRKMYADGTDSGDPIQPDATPTAVSTPLATTQSSAAPQSSFGKFLKGMSKSYSDNPDGGAGGAPAPGGNYGAQALSNGMSGFVQGIGSNFTPSTLNSDQTAGLQSSVNQLSGGSGTPAKIGQKSTADIADDGMAKGGEVKALVSPGEKYLPPAAVKKVEQGASPMKVGQTIPGKPAVGGAKNSYANDTVKKDLKEGGIIVPRSETKSGDPERKSADFVAAVLAKRKARA